MHSHADNSGLTLAFLKKISVSIPWYINLSHSNNGNYGWTLLNPGMKCSFQVSITLFATFCLCMFGDTNWHFNFSCSKVYSSSFDVSLSSMKVEEAYPLDFNMS